MYYYAIFIIEIILILEEVIPLKKNKKIIIVGLSDVLFRDFRKEVVETN